jgi:hypothetical protein
VRAYGRLPTVVCHDDSGRAGAGRVPEAGRAGHARFVFRLRVSSTAGAGLQAEWGRCRWSWNECVAKTQQVHAENANVSAAVAKKTCGPAQLDRMLTGARKGNTWQAASSYEWCGRVSSRRTRLAFASTRTASGTGTPASSSLR